MSDNKPANSLSLKQVLLFGGLMVTLSMGIRHGFGLFNLPITSACLLYTSDAADE